MTAAGVRNLWRALVIVGLSVLAMSPGAQATQDSIEPARTHSLTVRTVPASAEVTVTASSGTIQAGRSPLTVTAAEGEVTLTIRHPGYEQRTEQLVLDGPTTVTRWLDPAGQLLRKRYEVQTGSNPKQVAFTPNGKQLWVPLLGSRGVQVFDTASGAKLATIPLGATGGAVEVIFTKDGGRAYVSQMETASVYEIDTATRKVLRRLVTGGSWTKVLLLSADEQTLWAANWVSDDISEFDLKTGVVKRRIRTVDTPRGLALDPSGAALWVAGFDGGELARIDLASGTQAIVQRTGGAMRHLVVHPGSSRLYADDMGRDNVFVTDLSSPLQRPISLAKTDSHPNTLDVSPDGAVLFVSNRGANNPKGYGNPGPEWGTVIVFDSATGRRLDTIVAGNQTTGLDVSDNGRLLAYTDFLDNRLAVYEIPATELLINGNGGRSAAAQRELVKKR
jgi:DNA-binding beta-propeller fold protein YncE